MSKLHEEKDLVQIPNYDRILKVLDETDLLRIKPIEEMIGIYIKTDEYKREAIEIANRSRIYDEEKLADFIYRVFVEWNAKGLVPEQGSEIYKEIAKRIKSENI